MIKLNKFLKVIFHFINLLLILFYLYPGSISGYILYNDLTKQPQVTDDFFYISSQTPFMPIDPNFLTLFFH